jgi:hypothetical protein
MDHVIVAVAGDCILIAIKAETGAFLAADIPRHDRYTAPGARVDRRDLVPAREGKLFGQFAGPA